MKHPVSQAIVKQVAAWPGVSVLPHRFGGVEFRVANHEIGHLHGDRLADLPFPVRIRKELVAAGKAVLHHFLPETGWVSRYIAGPDDIPAVVELFRMNYERLTTAVARLGGHERAGETGG